MARSTYILVGIGCTGIAILGVGCLALFGGLAWLGFGAYKDLTKAADQFLVLVGNNDFQGAYQATSPLLQSQKTEEEFTAEMKRLGLDGYQASSWNSFNMVNNQGTVSGNVTLKTGSIPLTIQLQKESGVWKVTALNPPATGANSQSITPPITVPTNEKLRTMSATTMNNFDAAVKAKDFTSFYDSISATWRAQTKPEDMKTTFQTFIDKNLLLGKVDVKDVVITGKPEINDKGTLRFEGNIPRAENTWNFRLSYVMENNEWKLIGLFVNVQ